MGILFTNLGQDYAQISSLHYKPYDQFQSTFRGENEEQDPKKAIFYAYDRGDYEETIEKIQSLEPIDRTEQTNFMLANSYQATEDFEKATDLYTKIIGMDGVYASPSRWYLALCYLSTDQYAKAKPLLDELAVSTSSYSRNAKELLKDLK